MPICEDIRSLTNEWIIANTKHDGLSPSTLYGSIKETGDYNKERQVESSELERGGRCRCGQCICSEPQIDLLTGGFPCQPFSVAGQQRGKDDDRYLWPEMLRVIRETRPRWIIGENVAGIINLALDEVCASLEVEGYEVQPVIIPACAVNAPHRRDRVWILSYNNTNPNTERLEGQPKTGYIQEQGTESGHQRLRRFNPTWDKNWLKVATELCGVDDGISVELDELKLSKSGHRRERIKSLGNAIVPQVSQVIMQAIKEITHHMESKLCKK